MHTTTSMSKIHPGIPSCSASGKASTNGLHKIRKTSNGIPCASSNKMNIIIMIPVAASARA